MRSLSPSELVAVKREIIRDLCVRDHLFFTRYFFKLREGISFRANWHHRVMCNELQKVFDGETENLLLNVAPGSSKTELFVVNFMARGLALNPRARFLHLSYSDDLASTNSAKAKEIVQSAEFQELWPMLIKDDSRSKKRWNVEVDERTAGGCYAAALGGQITGFRAGHMVPGFQGAIIVDDPLKPEDGFSQTKRDQANRKILSTVKSRKANPRTPLVVIMQRIAAEDPSGYILAGEVPGKWRHVLIPALITDEEIAKCDLNIVGDYDDGERDDKGRFSYWPYKEPLEELLAMEKGTAKRGEKSISTYVFSGQYQQRPSPLGGGLIKGAWFGRYAKLPRLKYRVIYADTAQKTAQRNDFSVFECWGLGQDGNIYLIDLLRGKWEAPELEQNAKDFWAKHKAVGPVHIAGTLRKMKVEDKASGTGLIQSIARNNRIPVEGIPRETDKLTRLLDVQAEIKAGFVYLPEEATFVSDFIRECEAFTPDDSHDHDDQIDPMIDAINDMLKNVTKIPDLRNFVKG